MQRDRTLGGSLAERDIGTTEGDGIMANEPATVGPDSEAKGGVSRSTFIKSGLGAVGGLMLGGHLGGSSRVAAKSSPSNPVTGPEAVYGFNVPLTGSYADEGADELK
ncbi:MAG: hypothetical protein ACRD0G_02875, partial [Acidimicrobiales bacterium]